MRIVHQICYDWTLSLKNELVKHKVNVAVGEFSYIVIEDSLYQKIKSVFEGLSIMHATGSEYDNEEFELADYLVLNSRP